MRSSKHWRLIMVVSLLLISSGTTTGQTGASTPGDVVAKTRADLITSTRTLKANTEDLLALEESEVHRATESLALLHQLLAEGLVARQEVTAGEEALAAAQSKLIKSREQIVAADRLIAEVQSAEELAKAQPPPVPPTLPQVRLTGSYSSTGVMIRYNGTTRFSVADISRVQSFFAAQFGRTLPISAFGQTATHNQLGFDHRNAVDVALHPDSAQGRTLINYLQSQSITFIAFRAAVPGSATGPHIHIGAGSRRLA